MNTIFICAFLKRHTLQLESRCSLANRVIIITIVAATLDLENDGIQETPTSNNKQIDNSILTKINDKFIGYLSIYTIFQVPTFFCTANRRKRRC